MAVGHVAVVRIVAVDTAAIRIMIVALKRSPEFRIGHPAVRQDERFEEKGQADEDFPPTANPPAQGAQQD